MDWPLAITRNQDALKRIVAAMFAMLRNSGDSFLAGNAQKVTVPDLGTAGVLTDAAAMRLVRADLVAIGYQVTPDGAHDDDLATVLRAFQRHWRQDEINGLADAGTRARLRAVRALCEAGD